LLESVYPGEYEFTLNSRINLSSIKKEVNGYFVEIIADYLIEEEEDP